MIQLKTRKKTNQKMAIDEERSEVFIRAHSREFPAYLEELEKEAKEQDVPVIRKGTQELLRFLLCLKNPVRILEIGTAVGFSSLLMAEYTKENCSITTVENYAPRIEEAKKNFEKYDKNKKIKILEGDAGEILSKLEGKYDFIFLDGPKGQYEAYLDDILRIMDYKALLVTDNIFKEGDVLESRYALERRDRTIHSRMREFLLRLRDEESLESVILSNGDGATLSVKKWIKNEES